MICIAITIFALFDCKDTNAIPTTTNNPVLFLIDKSIRAHNEMTDFHKKKISIDQQNASIAKNDKLETHQKHKTIRQVSSDIPVAQISTSLDYINTGKYFYSNPLLMYPFPMTNSYYPKYFPYAYNYPGYLQGYGNSFIG